MADVFKRTELNYGGGFTADEGLITPDAGLAGVMMTQLSIQYSQSISKINDIGNVGARPSFYLVGGRPQGNLSVGHVVGPNLALKGFYDKFSDVCQARTNSIRLNLKKAACDTAAGAIQNAIILTAKYCILTNVGFNVSAQDLMINEQSGLMFGNLDFDVQGFNAGAGFVGGQAIGAIADAQGFFR